MAAVTIKEARKLGGELLVSNGFVQEGAYWVRPETGEVGRLTYIPRDPKVADQMVTEVMLQGREALNIVPLIKF